jgi:hypothetical protein
VSSFDWVSRRRADSRPGLQGVRSTTTGVEGDRHRYSGSSPTRVPPATSAISACAISS